ncbi:MAG: PAS domain S-box protein [Deltaproteobacteria bacterium]|nr:MAG: PAS domain S-box protein [Deltaproteobacteria bacterium]
MSDLPFVGLINNVALLLALGVLYGLLQQRSADLPWQMLRGVLFGLIGIGVMLNPWHFSPGIIFDTRSILLGVGGLFLGTVSTLIALVIACSYRIYIGGGGATMGVGVLITSGILGLVWSKLRPKPVWQFSKGEFYLFGLVIHLFMMLWMVALPESTFWLAVQRMFFPVMLIYPIGTVLLASLLAGQEQQFNDRRERENSERQLQQLVEASPVPLVITRGNRDIVFVNTKFTELFGYTLDDIPTIEEWWHLAYPDTAYREELKRRWNEAATRAIAAQSEIEPQTARVTCKDGSTREVVGHFSSIGEKDIVILNDVTRERELDRMKSEFIATAAHELRTPLTSIMGFTDLLLISRDADQDRREELLGIIMKKSEALETIVNDLLDLGRVESGRLIHLDKRPADIRALIASTVAAYRQEFHSPRFEFDWPEPGPGTIPLDPRRISQVMENLLSNAVKFSPAGGPIVVSGSSASGEVAITVRDKGIGMNSKEVAQIFDKFYRADSSHTAVPGLGLGMSIAKGIVEAHGGRIHVESRKGAGTSVTFTLPAVPDAAT